MSLINEISKKIVVDKDFEKDFEFRISNKKLDCLITSANCFGIGISKGKIMQGEMTIVLIFSYDLELVLFNNLSEIYPEITESECNEKIKQIKTKALALKQGGSL